MSYDPSRHLEVKPPSEWFKDVNGYTYLHDPIEGTPLRGYDLDRDPNKIPPMFSEDMDTKDGLFAWKMAADNAENVFDVGILLTDPSQPDGLGDPGQLRELVNAYDMVGHAATRGALHTIWQHKKIGNGEIISGQWLGHAESHPAYTAQLKEELATTGKPSFSIDPSIQSGLSVPMTRLVQRVRDKVFNLADMQTDIHEPEDAVVFADMVHVDSLGYLLVANAGLKMDITVEEDGIYPNSALLIVPAELSTVIDKQKIARGFNPGVEHEETQVYTANERFAEDLYFSMYAMALSEGRMPIPPQ